MRDEVGISAMIGRTMVSVTGEVGAEEMMFTADDGSTFRFYHYHDCCESVDIEDICGDLGDLVGSPITQAEEVTSGPGVTGPEPEYYESLTWTFYKFGTNKGTVTVRWLGQSNGYYSEEVAFEAEIKEVV